MTITTKDNAVVHAEGMAPKDIERLLAQARNILAFDTTKKEQPSE